MILMIEYFLETDIRGDCWTWILSGEHSCTVFETPRVQISVMEPAIFLTSSIGPGSFRVCSLNYPFSLMYYFWFLYEFRTALITSSKLCFSNIVYGLFCSRFSKVSSPVGIVTLLYFIWTAVETNPVPEMAFMKTNYVLPVDIATGYRLYVGVGFSAGAMFSSPKRRAQLWVHRVSYPIGTRGFSLG
jgi:hypothetical protein